VARHAIVPGPETPKARYSAHSHTRFDRAGITGPRTAVGVDRVCEIAPEAILPTDTAAKLTSPR